MGSLNNVRKTWDRFAHEKPYWSVLTTSSEDQRNLFYKSGRDDVESILHRTESHGILNGTAKALDFGCGLGRLTYPLCERFEDVAAVDISRKMIELAGTRDRCPENVTFYSISNSELSFLPDESFDFVLSLIVLQHMPKRFMVKYLREFARVAKPNGAVVFQVPTHRQKIETGKVELWKEKPLLSDNPAFHTLCYRIVSRSLRWTKRMRKRSILSNEIRYRLECRWKTMTGGEIMLMNTLDDKLIRKVLSEESCEVVSSEEDGRAGKGYTSKLYFAKKTGSNKSAHTTPAIAPR